MNKIALDIVTPNGSVYSEHEAELVVLQTESGEMGVMAGHIPTVAPLKIGAVRVTRSGNDKDHIAVTEGFAEIRPEKVTILVQSAEQADEIDIERAKASLLRAEERMKEDKAEHVDFHRAERALHRAMNRLEVAKYR
ncbi:F0F1 ATP synthase subunit epsilon [Macrococcus epidermidis]|uniref:ATP synthase epsilon chain n=1 Tax=Macrococcus epidermidis TaxID=1902580 RepID=A0A327ZPB5_9STAP|nr:MULTISPECIES: F0F1 ATP synthase subunit epsilon [Macrococcus]MCG7420882.1 F0F1 ATP synthase subunit epsilon [Macrococcus epidermidis]MCH4985979.1 F0F1 ATP synthase subunit epsilon [Macrococcus sp. PK]RAK44162.1 F0F1 ATP synthase subunit epsilon [Macrococcus epidermidis]UTH15924.1 F0F1 ATP synthase subunit epsilon [Macrococcus epidermidis]